MDKFATFVVACATLSCLASSPSMAQSEEEFYHGKTISLIIPIGPGGAYDAYGRLVARHLRKHIPGNPVIVPRNMPGGGGVVASNYAYNVAPQDGTTLIVITSTFAVEQMLDSPQIKYDARNFRGIGRMTDTTSTVTFWHDADVETAADLFTKPSIVAVAAVNEIWSVRLMVMNQLLGTKMKLVAGYPSGSDKVLAVERREADGFWMPYITLAELYPSYLKEQKLRVILQSATIRNKQIPDVPTMLELTSDQEVQQVFRYLVSNDELGRSLFTTPGVPPIRVGRLRSAFQTMLLDSEFQADAKKIGMPLGPASGEDVDKIVLDTFNVSQTALKRVKDLMKAN